MENMKTSVKYIAIVWPLTLLMTTGCRQEVFVADDGETLTVRIADEAVHTRTSFTNFDGMFKWDENDQIKVHYADGRFETKTINVDGNDPSAGTVLSSTAGTKLRDFFAVFPASSAVDPGQGDAAPKVTLPSSYDISGIVAGTSTLTLDHVPTPMVAKNTPGEDLQFHHVGGLLRISLKDLKPTIKRVRITFDRGVTGTFPVNVDDPDQPYIDNTAVAEGNNVVTFEVASSASGIGSGVTSLLLNVPVPCGTYGEITLEALDNGGDVLFTRSHTEPVLIFERAHGKRLTVGKTSLEYNLEMGNYEDDWSLSYQGGVVELVHSVISYKTDGTTFIPEPLHLEYSETGDAGTWSTDAPDWLGVGAGSDLQGGVEGAIVTLAVSPQKNDVKTNRNGVPVDDHSDVLSERDELERDLSTFNVATNQTGIPRTTANCYVVNAPGTYRFPVVYGNAIKNNETNTDAFFATLHQEGLGPYDEYVDSYGHIWMRYYKDHLDQDIKEPYLEKQLGAVFSNPTAQLLWSDANGLIDLESVVYHKGATADVSYIEFQIHPEDICQGNAVIGVFDNLGRVAWSWHIWVTDADLTAFNTGYDDLHYSKINLGWCDKKEVARYPAREYYVRIAQDSPDGKVSRKIKIATTVGPNIFYQGNNPYYQGNRKDPMVAWKGIGTDKKEYQATGDFYPRTGGDVENPTIGDYIQHPNLHYRFTIEYVNAWNSNWDTVNNKLGTKTIYDPTPVGFKLPQNYNTEPVPGSGNERVFFATVVQWDADFNGYKCTDKIGDDEFIPMVGLIDPSGGLSSIGSESHFWYAGGTGNWLGVVTNNRYTLTTSGTNKHHGATIPQALSVRPMFEPVEP